MPIKLIGKKVKFTGKSLWEILGNLKNCGVGRIVYKDHFLNYPETSYYKIVKVQPVMAPKEKYHNRLVMVWAEHVFRGKKYPDLVQMHYYTYKTAFHLVPRSEEHKYTNFEKSTEDHSVPELREWPPLLKIFLESESKKEGKELPKLSNKISSKLNSFARIDDKKDALKEIQPKLYLDQTVAELTKQLETLKSAQT